MGRNELINPNPKPKHSILTGPRRRLRLLTIHILKGVDLRNHILVLGRDNLIIDRCATNC